MLAVSILGSVAFLGTLIVTRLLIRYSENLKMVDAPNDRSSHSVPTPKGGGLGFFFVFMMAAIGLNVINEDYAPIVHPLLFGGPAVVLLGWLDDRFTLSARFRLCVHFFVATVIYGFVTKWFQDPLYISFLPEIFWVNSTFCILFIAWFINLYNFMDGADGLTGSTAVAGSILLGVVSILHNSPEIAMIYCLIAYTVGGFLVFNWAPARIFMGDTGSYFLGFLFASLALVSKTSADISFYSHLIIFGFFIVDATYILFYRLVTRKPLFKAHRTFNFHKLMLKGWSHSRIAVFYTMVLVLWLFPLANLASIYDNFGVGIVAIAYLPLLLISIYNRAGEADLRKV